MILVHIATFAAELEPASGGDRTLTVIATKSGFSRAQGTPLAGGNSVAEVGQHVGHRPIML